MATNRPLSYHHYYQIVSRFRSKSSDSLSHRNSKHETTEKAKQTNRTTKMKKSSTALAGFELKSLPTATTLRRRFSLFRPKRSSPSNENTDVQVLQHSIEQLKGDLQSKNDELQIVKEQIENKRNHNTSLSNESIEQAMQLQTMLNAKLEELLRGNDLLKKSIEELQSFAQQDKAPNSPHTTSIAPSNSIIKSTNFTESIPVSRSEIRHKSGIEIEVKQEKKPTSSYPPIIRPTGLTNKRIPTDENPFSSLYQTPKRRLLVNSIQTQTPPSFFHQHEQQLKSLTDETLSKNEKIQALLRELTDCQAIIKQQEQQLVNGKKDRDQLYFIVDERANELRNLRQKNEQLEQMIRNEREHSNDEKKLFVLLQESQEERDHLLNQQRQTYERINKLEEQNQHYESDATKMRDHVLCSKIKLDKKTDENLDLINELTDMKTFCQSLEEENQRLRSQIEYERTKSEECTKLKSLVEIELEKSLDKLRTQRYEHETKLSLLDESFQSSQKQYQLLQQNQHTIEEKYQKEIHRLKEHIHQLEQKIEEVIQDKTSIAIRCGELIDENRKLEKVLIDKEDDYEEKIKIYREKNSLLSTKLDEVEKRLMDTKKQLELFTIEKDETLADMLIAVRVASELRYDAEDRLSKANDDLKRVTEHIEQERAVEKEVQRRQAKGLPVEITRTASQGMQLPPINDIGHVKIKEMIRTLEANSGNNARNKHPESTIRQRPVSQPCTRTETNALLTHKHHRQFGTSTDDAKILSSTKNDSPLLNHSHRSDVSIRSITNEQYEEMKSIVEAVFARMPGSVCKRDALLKWCVERLINYGIPITNFSNSWTDGIAFCCLLHSYLPDRIDLEMIKNESKKQRFELAFNIASSVGIVSILDIEEMCSSEWPDWERVMYYVALIFRHFESSTSNQTLSPILPIPQATSSPISPAFSAASSPSLCASIRTTSSIPTILCSPLQTV